MGFDFRRLKKIEQASEFMLDVIIEALQEIEVELARDDEFEKAAIIRDEIKKLKGEYERISNN